ncbi:hypothetical protein ABZT03_09980 [Streptomyces sp. NPDC005574]|uniref:hypothetical protein n=1 Tax=Streptomyces sp. NPDC005574 TaxID=3156891 RepID=UPI0033A69E16
MFRGTTVRTVLAVLSAVLLALPLFTPTPSFATAHTTRQAEAKALPGTALPDTAPRTETVTHRHCDHTGGPAGPLRTRDRHRAADLAPEVPERAFPARDPAAPREPLTSAARSAPRSVPDRSPAVLQVFRC